MSKVISMFTKQEVTELPFSSDAAKLILGYLLDYNSKSKSEEERAILFYVINYISNNSGVAINEVVQEKTS